MAWVHYKKIIVYSYIFLLIFPGITIYLPFLREINGGYSKKISTSDSYLELDLSDLPPIEYETLNKSWHNPNIEMIIVVPNISEFISAVEPLRDWKNEKGVKTIILNNFSLYSGRDTAEKIRNMIKSYYESDKIRWVLLAGDAQNNLIPIRKVYNPDTVIASEEFEGTFSEYSDWDEYFKPTDYYYADLNGTWDEDGDGYYGESANYNLHGIDEIDWTPEVYVGRLPASTANDLEIMVNKTIDYEKGVNSGQWMNKMLLAGGISDTKAQEPPDGEDEASLTEYIWKNYVEAEMNFTHLYKTTDFSVDTDVDPPDEVLELNPDNFDTKFNNGSSTVMFAGHGSPTQFESRALGTFYTSSEAQSCSNLGSPSLLYASACTTGPYDKNDDNIGEILIKKNNAGAIGYIGSLRVTWYVLNDYNFEVMNRGNAKLFWKVFFEDNTYQQGKALYDSKIAYMNSLYFNIISSIEKEWERKNLLTYNLLGDPEVDIFTSTPVEAIDTIPDTLYGGELMVANITNTRGNLVPYARIHITNNYGVYHTVYADENGVVKFRVPHDTGKTYNFTISGHNLIPTSFNFTIIPDETDPVIDQCIRLPENPTISTNLNFYIEVNENESGTESIFVLLSKTNFKDYFYYQIKNDYYQNENNFSLVIHKLDPGNYKYCIFARDYNNNSNLLYNNSFEFRINSPITDYFLIGGIFTMGAVIIASLFLVYVYIKHFPEEIEKLKNL
ncbi:MAG: C25 family cysteine peptidase [Promethearchaeati archaeon]